MFKIKAPTNFTGEGWGLNFVKGEAETDNAMLAKKLQSKGYKVEVVEEPDDSSKFLCPVCGKAYKSESALDKHIAKEHPENSSEDDETPEE